MIDRCSCGQVEIDFQGEKLVIHAHETTAVVTLGRTSEQVRIEHLVCQSCLRATLPSG